MKTEKKYYKELDIIRVLACIGVLLYHLGVLKGGYLAVCIFFVLTGYLAVISAFSKEKFSLWEYYKSRFIHIYVPLLIIVFLTISIIPFIPDNNWINIKPETLSVIGGYNNYWQINANLDYFARHVSTPFMHFWYIGILLQFELIFPLIFCLFKKIGEKIHKIIPCIILFIASLLFTYQFYYMSGHAGVMVVYYDSLCRAFSIIFGVTLGFIMHYYKHLIPKFLNNKTISNVIFAIYLIAIVVMMLFVGADSKYFAIAMIVTTLIALRMIDFGTINSNAELNVFDRLIKSIANISYEVYLIQYPVIYLFQYNMMNPVLKITIIIAITVALSYLIHYAFGKSKFLLGLKYILMVVFILASIYGVYQFIITKDYQKEMQELQEQLAENEKLIELRQEEYALKLKEQEEDWASELAALDDGEAKIADIVKNLSIVCIGDSVMLGAVPNLNKQFPNGYFDAKISRTDYVVNDILVELKNKKMLGSPIVLNFGANGDCRNNKCKEQLMKTAGDRDVFWLTVTNDKDVHFNSRIREFAKNYPNLHIIDWESISKGHTEYFYKDGIHLTEPGRKAYVKAVYDAIYNQYLDEFNKEKQAVIDKHEAELKTKISFYGDSILIGVFNDLHENFPDAKFITDKDFNFESLKAELAKEIAEKTINYNVVLAFDSLVDLGSLSKEKYQELLELCKDQKIYVVKTVENLEVPEEISIIDFYQILKDNPEYTVRDSAYLTDEGNKALNKLLNEYFNPVEEVEEN